MSKHKKILTFFLAAGLGLSLFGGALALVTFPREPAAETFSADPERFVLRTQNDSICVYLDGVLVCDTGISPAGLPQQDQEALEQGISAADTDALTGLLEDFSS